MHFWTVPALVLLVTSAVSAQTTRPTTQPSTQPYDQLKTMTAEEVMNAALKPSANPGKPLQPISDRPVQDKSSGGGAVVPNAPGVTVLREGTYVIDRIARLTRTATGQSELTFDSDGKALRDPPMLALPNLKLQQMEDSVTIGSRDYKWRITGMVTEYKGRNYILLEKIVAIADVQQQF